MGAETSDIQSFEAEGPSDRADLDTLLLVLGTADGGLRERLGGMSDADKALCAVFVRRLFEPFADGEAAERLAWFADAYLTLPAPAKECVRLWSRGVLGRAGG